MGVERTQRLPSPEDGRGTVSRSAELTRIKADRDRQTWTLPQFRGRPVTLVVWASGCTWCRKMVSSTVELHRQYGDRLVVIGLNALESPDVVRPFAAEHGMTYLNLIADAPTLQRYGVRGHPLTVLITARGEVFNGYTGFTDKSLLERDVRTLLGLE